jgi:3',5'-nucleoside bisphosphate phosphatase
MILEIHCHTAEHSECSNVRAVDIAQHNFDIGLEGIVFTETIIISGSGERLRH